MIKEILIGAGGIVAVSAVVLVIKQKKEHGSMAYKTEKIYVDEANLGEIKAWFDDKMIGKTNKGLIFYPTRDNIMKWKLNVPEGGNVLIQIVFNEEQGCIVNYREVTFSNLSPKLKALLDNNGGTIVVD